MLFSLPVGTEMFHFPTFPPHTLYIQVQVTGLASSRVSPFGNPRITVWLSTPRGLSQIPTSFFGSWYQGIHRVPLKTWPQRCSRPLFSSQHTTGTTPGHPNPRPDHPTQPTHQDTRHPPQKGGRPPDPSGPNNVPARTTNPRKPPPSTTPPPPTPPHEEEKQKTSRARTSRTHPSQRHQPMFHP